MRPNQKHCSQLLSRKFSCGSVSPLVNGRIIQSFSIIFYLMFMVQILECFSILVPLHYGTLAMTSLYRLYNSTNNGLDLYLVGKYCFLFLKSKWWSQLIKLKFTIKAIWSVRRFRLKLNLQRGKAQSLRLRIFELWGLYI